MACLNFDRWKNTLVTANAVTWTMALPYNTNKRPFLKIHNRSKTDYLKVGFSEADTLSDIYVLVAPGGFWEQDHSVPRNAIWVASETEDIDVIIIQRDEVYNTTN